MELDNCTDVDRLMNRYYLPVSYGIICIVGLVGNVTAIGIYVTKLRPWKSSSIIMVNLALTDLLYVLSMPFLIYYYVNEDWTLGDFMCRFVRFGFHFNLYGSILFLTCLAVFRYVVVIQPLIAAQVQRKFWGIIACSAVWIIAAAEIIPMLTMISFEESNNKTYCLDFASSTDVYTVRWYGWLVTTLGFLLPLVVVFMCYIGIVKELANGPQTTSPCRMRARRVTVLILVVFVVCFLPYHILRVLRIETRNSTCMVERNVHTAYIISRPLAGFNTFFNLALYTLSGDQFRRAFLSTFYSEYWLSKARSLLHVTVISKAGRDMPAA
ncbi:2-oxoglutarate receptor 1-like [Sebastes fasciatus]|uniref:2-oxoglutarate receptor 1-like n=1 Tax=Sebastes fasciatus TaxID=394691 RepID=UPI003D9E967D